MADRFITQPRTKRGVGIRGGGGIDHSVLTVPFRVNRGTEASGGVERKTCLSGAVFFARPAWAGLLLDGEVLVRLPSCIAKQEERWPVEATSSSVFVQQAGAPTRSSRLGNQATVPNTWMMLPSRAVNLSPLFSGPTPAGVPVKTTSPGSRVKVWLISLISSKVGNSIWPV